jgi:valyl-tRNA synthetase
MQPLAGPAIEAVRNGSVRFVPERFAKIYYNWMENVRDWCISRQLWWGHRIPAYDCLECGYTTVEYEKPSQCPVCRSENIKQDEDVLDTWFSSALWPFSTLGWPEDTEDFRYFYPTDVLVTGYDIIFFWVARMIFSAIEHTGRVPFSHVFIHGIVRDAEGRKMSKSLGNGIDPLDVIEKYGTDALRFALSVGNSPGNDLRFSEEKVEAGRNFANKIWNAARFALMNFDREPDFSKVDRGRFTLEDKWILSRLNNLTAEVTANIDNFELGIALQKVYEFIWDEFCDWYIEMVKPRLYDRESSGRLEAQYVLSHVLRTAMKLLHPFMPFITEEIYLHLPYHDESITISAWPEYSAEFDYPEEEKNMRLLMDAIRSIRNIRAEMNVPVARKAKVVFVTADSRKQEILNSGEKHFKTLAGISSMAVQSDKAGIADDAVTAVIEGVEIYLPLEDLIDLDREIERLEKERDNLQKELDRVDGMLSNKSFIERAPEKIVLAEREKKAKYTEMFNKVVERLERLRTK